MSDEIDPERKFSNGMDWDNSIDYDDASDGSDGGYNRHGSPINPDAMKELIHLRIEVARLQEKCDLLNAILTNVSLAMEAFCEKGKTNE